MCVIIILAVWTTTGTFMLMFLAVLQDLPVEVDEAAMLDGVSPWQKLRLVTIPLLKPALFLIIVILTWGQRRLMREDKTSGRLRRAFGRAALTQNNQQSGPTPRQPPPSPPRPPIPRTPRHPNTGP